MNIIMHIYTHMQHSFACNNWRYNQSISSSLISCNTSVQEVVDTQSFLTGKMKLPDCSSVASLCVTFTFHSSDKPLVHTDLPWGVFCRLAVQLSNGPWTPIPEESDRTTVKLYSSKFDLYLTEAPGFISLTPVLVEELEGKEPLAELHALCQQLYDTLHKSIVPSAKDVLGEEFSQTAKIVFGFECGCGNVPHLATPVSAKGKSLICQATHTRRKSLKKERIWFSPVDGIEVRSWCLWCIHNFCYRLIHLVVNKL